MRRGPVRACQEAPKRPSLADRAPKALGADLDGRQVTIAPIKSTTLSRHLKTTMGPTWARGPLCETSMGKGFPKWLVSTAL